MANYPDFDQTTESRETWIDDIQVGRASNGAARGRALFTGRKLKLELSHVVLREDADALLTFYDTNRLQSVDVTWSGDGITRTMLFASAPSIEPIEGPWWAVTNTFEEV